ncbi:MAG: hypothetical protein JW832_16830 [Deltaproteobacteria bacterium]|nr:hypothetical protein [Deltaproteobacteria bacterium]
MKKKAVQFGGALFGACAGAVLYVLVWGYIDRFFYDVFGIVLQCDGCHGPSLSLIYGFIPVAAAVCSTACSAVFFREGGWALFARCLAACTVVGGTLSLGAVYVAAGGVAAVLVACSMGLAALLAGACPRVSEGRPERVP